MEASTSSHSSSRDRSKRSTSARRPRSSAKTTSQLKRRSENDEKAKSTIEMAEKYEEN